MASYLKPRRGTYSTASSKLKSSADGVLKNGEIFFELNSSGAGKGVGKIKMGDGSTNYSSLPYFLSLQDSNITFIDNESSNQIGALVSGISIPDAFRHIKSSLAYLKTQVTNLNNDLSNFSRFNHIYATYNGSLAVAANNKQVTTFSFDKTFKVSPVVTVTVEHSSGWSDAFTLCITKVTTTNVTVSVHNKAAANATITLHVIAIGTI